MKNIKPIHITSIKTLVAALALCTLTVNDGAQAAKSYSIASTKNKQFSNNPDYLFNKLRSNFAIKKHTSGTHEHKEIQKHVIQYTRTKKTLIKNAVHAGLHLDYIITQVEKRNLPGELALLPMLESNYKKGATSNRGAAGIWQIMPDTGKRFGLKQTAEYDGRRDLKASTKAALNYLEYLHRIFKGDWMLALAAYNAGEGTVINAIKRNQNAGKPTTFWFLELPKQTRIYVPKFLALAQVINQH
jgi:membrane-bound lytic murein transglycosylase D